MAFSSAVAFWIFWATNRRTWAPMVSKPRLIRAAGYKGLSDQLGELSAKTQVVGDVNEETANKFLRSMACWVFCASW